jgi:hypothetical protein
MAALHGVLRCSFITYKLRASNTLRLALGHAHSLLQRFLNFEPPAIDSKIRAAAVQFVRKVSGSSKPSHANKAVFDRAIDDITVTVNHLLGSLVTTAAPRDRDLEAAKARARIARRFGTVA